MLVEEIMKTDVITCHKDETIYQALGLMKKNKIRHLPIIDDQDHLVGIVAERNLKEALPLAAEQAIEETFFAKPISEVMVTDLVTAHRLDFVEDLAAVLYEHKIGCIPIIEHDKVIGLVTETDMLYTLVQLTGAHQPSSLIEVQVENRSGTLAEVAQIIGSHNVNITSILVYPNSNKKMKSLVFRIQTIDPNQIIQDLEKNGYHVPWPNLPGISE